ncbi:MAG: 16S rRNA (guanine(527)-N(7))-methyltransferase RsmG [Casimicrobiaceae bacterium]
MIAAAVASGIKAELAAGLAALRLDVPSRARQKLTAYVELLAKWNRIYNLTAIREPERMVTHHVLDSLSVLPALVPLLAVPTCVRMLDVGAGAGLPGIPLAIARPDWDVTLLDSSQKKVAFMTQTAIELELGNVKAHAARVEQFAAHAPFEVVIARAFSALAAFVRCSARHLAPGGRLVAMKGIYPEEELATLPRDIKVLAITALTVPGLAAERHLVVMEQRDASTRAPR